MILAFTLVKVFLHRDLREFETGNTNLAVTWITIDISTEKRVANFEDIMRFFIDLVHPVHRSVSKNIPAHSSLCTHVYSTAHWCTLYALVHSNLSQVHFSSPWFTPIHPSAPWYTPVYYSTPWCIPVHSSYFSAGSFELIFELCC